MTEQEAKEKWCPMARTVSDTTHHVTVNRLADRGPNNADSDCLCLASTCMMWRWSVRGAEVDGKYDANYPLLGYCGLGGKP